MYQILLTSHKNGETKRFAANVNPSDYTFIDNDLSVLGGVEYFGVDLYDDKVSATEYEGYGKFQTLSELVAWLAENVFGDKFTMERYNDIKKQTLAYKMTIMEAAHDKMVSAWNHFLDSVEGMLGIYDELPIHNGCGSTEEPYQIFTPAYDEESDELWEMKVDKVRYNHETWDIEFHLVSFRFEEADEWIPQRRLIKDDLERLLTSIVYP